MSLSYLGHGLFRCSQGYVWPLWAVNANRSSRQLPTFSLARFESKCFECRERIDQDDPYIWERQSKRAFCLGCGQ